MKKVMLAVIIASTVIVGATCVFAERGGCGFGGDFHDGPGYMRMLLRGPWANVESAAKEAELADSQIKQIQSLRSEHRNTVEPLHSKARLAREDLEELLASGSASDQAQAQKYVDSLSEIHKKILSERLSVHYKLKEILTKEQQDKLEMMADEKRGSRKEFRERRHFRKDCPRGDGPGMNDPEDSEEPND